MTAAEAADRSGINRTTLYYRLKTGCPQNLLFAEPDVTNRFTTL
ncbi:helix-turn-helix domain-containing protein [Paenibacillus alkaliterrae]